MVLPSCYLEIILSDGTACGDAMVMYGGGFLKVLFESSSKGPRGFSYVLIITCKVPTMEPVDGPTLVVMGSLSLGETRRFLMVLLPLKWVCTLYLLQIFLMLLHRPWVKGMTI